MKNICLQWNDCGTEKDYLMIDSMVKSEKIEELIKESLATGSNECNEFRQRLSDNGIEWQEFECDYFDFN